MSASDDSGAESDLGAVGYQAAQDRAATDAHVLGFAAAAGDSDLANRYMAARYAGLAFGNDRDYYDVLGYTRSPNAEDYFAKYLRNDIARTIVDAKPKATWRARPDVVDEASDGPDDENDTDFEEAIEYLFDEHRLLHYLERADRVTGIGEFGLIFLGLAEEVENDESDDLSGSTTSTGGSVPSLEDPAEPDAYGSLLDTMDDRSREFDDLAYISTFSQARVQDIDIESNPLSPRYGLPNRYQIRFETNETEHTQWVHHSRVIHIAEGLLENEVFGRPRLEEVLNRIDDLEKVLGGSAEMFWRGADRKLHLNYEGDGLVQDSDEIANEAHELAHGLRDILTTQNTELNAIEGEDVDPTGIVEQELKLIAGAKGIPVRMLTGSERGELASTQDRATFYGRIMERQKQFAEAQILRPFIDRLIQLGIVPEPDGEDYKVEWPELFELNDLEQAELRERNANALATAAPNSDPGQVATTAEIREAVLEWDPEMGNESSLDEDPEVAEIEDEGGPLDFDDEDRDVFEEIMDRAGGGGPDSDDDPQGSDGEDGRPQ